MPRSSLKTHELFSNDEYKKIIFMYKGVMNNSMISNFTNFVEKELKRRANLSKRINRVIIELAQNIAYYSEEKCKENDEVKGVGHIALWEDKGSYIFVAGNRIKNIEAKSIIYKCNYINSLNKNDLSELKFQQRSDSEGGKNGCNIGFIQVATLSSNKLKPAFSKIDNALSNYSINIKFDKKN